METNIQTLTAEYRRAVLLADLAYGMEAANAFELEAEAGWLGYQLELALEEAGALPEDWREVMYGN